MQLKNTTSSEFEEVWDRVDLCMRRYARRNGFKIYLDYDIYVAFNGWSQIRLDILNLNVLTTRLVSKLRRQVKVRPNWEIIVVISVDPHRHEWPGMGIRIRAHEIVDDLQREFFPLKYRTLAFEGARRGTEADQ